MTFGFSVLPSHGMSRFSQGGYVRPGAGRRVAERAPERLVHVRHVAHGLRGQPLVALDQLQVVLVGDRLAVVVQRDLAVRSVQRDLRQGVLQFLLVAGDVALDFLERLDQPPRVHEEAVGEHAGRLRRRLATGRDVLEPLADDVVGVVLGLRRVQIAGRARTAGVHARNARSELLELRRRAPEHVAQELLGVDRPLGLLVGLQERDQSGAADGDERTVDVVRQLLSEGRVVRRVQRREDPLGDLSAGRAELRDEAGHRRPAEAVVVADHRRRPPTELVVGQVAQAGVELRAVTVEAREVRRPHLERGVLRAGRTVDEGLLRVLLGVVGHRDRLIARERADHDVRAELLHQPPRLLDGRARRVVAASDAHELERVPVDRAAGPSVARLVRVLRLGAGELSQRRDGSGHVLVVEGAERALALGEHGDLDRRLAAASLLLDRGVARGRLRGRRGLLGGAAPPPPLSSSSSPPQPAKASAAMPRRSANHIRPRLRFLTSDIAFSPPLAVDPCPGGVVLRARERR